MPFRLSFVLFLVESSTQHGTVSLLDGLLAGPNRRLKHDRTTDSLLTLAATQLFGITRFSTIELEPVNRVMYTQTKYELKERSLFLASLHALPRTVVHLIQPVVEACMDMLHSYLRGTYLP